MEGYIDLYADEWFITTGLIGLKRLYPDEVVAIAEGIRLSVDSLASLAERYFDYFISTYSVAERDSKRIGRLLTKAAGKPEDFTPSVSDIRKIMNDQIKKVEKYFSDTTEYDQLSWLAEEMKQYKKSTDIEELKKTVSKYLSIMKITFIDEKLTLNFAKAVIISPFYGQPSFLQKSCSSLSRQEHIEKMNTDLVKPAVLELQFKSLLTTAEDPKEIIAFLENNKDVSSFKAWIKAIKKEETIEGIRDYFRANVLPCSFVNELPATMSYEEMMFSPLGVSKNNAVNFYWDFNKKNPTPMSAVARLILFMFPVGITFYQRKLGNGQSGEYVQFAGVVIPNDRFEEIYKTNGYYRNIRQTGGSFEEAIIGILSDAKEKAERKETSYLFVEVFTESKKTLLDYYHMPAYASTYLKTFGGRLKNIFLYDQRDNFVRSILSGRDPIQEVFHILREAVQNSRYSNSAYTAVKERHRLLLLKKGVKGMEEMKKRDKKISVAFFQGKELRQTIISGREGASEIYRAGGDKKVQAIAYRLLNAAKSGNKQSFMDSLFRLHISAGKNVSPIFVEGLKEQGLDFETIAGAFIAGLLSSEMKDKQEGDGE